MKEPGQLGRKSILSERQIAQPRRILEAFAARLESQPSALPRMLCGWMLHEAPEELIRFRGAAEDLVREVRRHFLPFTTLVWEERSGAPSAEVCAGLVCHPRAGNVEELRPLLHWA